MIFIAFKIVKSIYCFFMREYFPFLNLKGVGIYAIYEASKLIHIVVTVLAYSSSTQITNKWKGVRMLLSHIRLLDRLALLTYFIKLYSLVHFKVRIFSILQHFARTNSFVHATP